MNGSNTYQERQSFVNIAEQIFEEYCTEKNYQFHRLGFNEKTRNINYFYDLNVLIRNLPDYIVDVGDQLFVVNVKGTANFKKKEVDMIPLFLEWYDSKKASLIYAFCFVGKKPKLIYPEKIIKLYDDSNDQQWSDGVIYRNLNLGEQK